MAKKQSVPLTPEELAAKKARKAEKRKIFGDTFFKAVAMLLAIVLVYSVVYVSFGSGMTVVQKVTATGGVASGSGAGAASSGTGASSSDPAAAADPGAASAGTGASAGAGAATNDAAAVADKINKATAAAVNAKAGYDWERHCTVNDIDVGSATDTLNKIIQGVDPNADLNSVVGGFLGRGDKKETVNKGETLDTKKVPKDDGTTENIYHGASYTLKATQLKAEDIKNLKINGDTYTFEIPDTNNPGRDYNTPLSRFTNDIVVQSEVDKEIKDQVSVVTVNSLEAKYTKIKVSVTIKDGKLTEMSYSYRGDATISLKALVVNVKGTGYILADAKYSNFKY